MEKKCNCGEQIVYWFDKPTVFVCFKCELALAFRVGDSNEECPFCGGLITFFEADGIKEKEEEDDD